MCVFLIPANLSLVSPITVLFIPKWEKIESIQSFCKSSCQYNNTIWVHNQLQSVLIVELHQLLTENWRGSTNKILYWFCGIVNLKVVNWRRNVCFMSLKNRKLCCMMSRFELHPGNQVYVVGEYPLKNTDLKYMHMYLKNWKHKSSTNSPQVGEHFTTLALCTQCCQCVGIVNS